MQHQHARTERAIQTITYMACTVMVHCILYCTEQGIYNLSLWSFAVTHFSWLHNQLPPGMSGLTLLELLTNSRDNHRDLLRSHVLRCPVYILEPSLKKMTRNLRCYGCI